MAIDVLRLWNMRCFADAEFQPDDAITLVCGPNGSGKSSLLESISLFSTLSSVRAGHLSMLIRHDSDEGGVRLEPDSGSLLEIRIKQGRAYLKAGGSGITSRDFLGRSKCVLFGPEDLDLVRGEPELRRRALDDLLVQLRPAYRNIRQEFERALRQRNAALRQQRGGDAAVYNAPLAASAAQVLSSRRRVVDDLSGHAADLYDDLSGKGKMSMRYKNSSDDPGLDGPELEAHLLATYESNLPVELERGTTRVGPHRDDLELYIDGHAARGYASRGEQRSVALALRLSELRLLPDAILLLDDVTSELDADRRRRVFKVAEGSQVVVTATEPDAVPDGIGIGALWTVNEGVLRAAG